MSAELSACGTYRYALWRDAPRSFAAERAHETCLFVMLNPSTADATVDDPTIRRCIGFARDWGFGRLAVANLYALRSTDPAAIAGHPDPVGPDNDAWIVRLANAASAAVVAWGANRHATPERVRDVVELIDRDTFTDYGVSCLGTTKHGHPRHPLYVPRDQQPVPFAL